MRRLTPAVRRWQLGLILALMTATAWADWSMFRLDPAHTGVVSDASLGQLAEAWSRDLGGSVDSSPAVVGGVVFVGNSLGQMHALSAADGTVLWQFETAGAVVSSPAVADGLVVFGSVDRFLYALRADTGELVWRYRTYGPIISSPTCADGVVYFTSMGGRAYAVALPDGALIWQSPQGEAIQCSPAVGGGVVYFGDDAGKIHALAVPDGSRVWEQQHQGRVVAGPTVGAGVVVFGIMSPSALRPPKIDHILAVNAQTGEKLWAQTEARSVMSAPVIAGESVYFVTIEGYLSKTEVRAAKLADGTELWKRVLGGVVDSSALLIGDKLVLGCHDGNLHLITAADGKVVQSVPLGPKVYSSPAWSDGSIYIGANDGKLYCLR